MKTRILFLVAAAAALASCSNPSVEGRWQDDSSSDTDGGMTLVYDFAPDGTLTLAAHGSVTYEGVGHFSVATVIPGTYTFKKNTLTLSFDRDGAKCDVDFEPSSFIGLLGDMATQDLQDEVANMYTQSVDSVLVFTNVKVSKDKFTYTESGNPGSATRLPDTD